MAPGAVVHQEHDYLARVQRSARIIFPGCCVFLFVEAVPLLKLDWCFCPEGGGGGNMAYKVAAKMCKLPWNGDAGGWGCLTMTSDEDIKLEATL
jgi:hypothetical protein